MQPPPLRSRSPDFLPPGRPAGRDGDSTGLLPGPVASVRAACRLLVVVLVTVVAMPVQAVLLLLPGRGKRAFARLYWAVLARIMGLRIRVQGVRAEANGRPVLFASNHSSWLDILVLGGTLHACFVAKAEVGRWPVIRTVARLGRTVFVSRRAQDTGRERDDMRARLQGGDDLLLFPEGTSSDGSRVLPFRSAFFSICEGGPGPVPVVQPVSVVYDRLAGLPLGRASRVQFAWCGDMDLATSLWRMARLRGGVRATVLLHPPLDPAAIGSRKVLAAQAWSVVAEGAAALRQNRGD